MDMQGSIYLNCTAGLIKSGKVSEGIINMAVKRILIAKYKLGLFDDPYRYCSSKREKEDIMTSDNISFAREFAAKSCVFKITQDELSYYHEDMSFTFDPGDFELFIGTSSAENKVAGFRLI